MPNPLKLVIVESPTKARTIRRFLGDEYRVEASMGHIRDLPANANEIPKDIKGKSWARLGVNVEEEFAPVYVVPADKKKVVKELKAALKDADELFLATDEDREGESIGWHILQVLKPKVPTRRMVFHEITREAIERALENSREIDVKLVQAQEARRVLDRLVGYVVSPLLWKKVKPRLSAGRVQSVAVRMLVIRERERIAFRSGSYWDLKARLAASGSGFDAQLVSLDGKTIATGRDFDEDTGQIREGRDVLLLGESDAKGLQSQLEGKDFKVASVEARDATRSPYPPFTTSTLQQEANRKLGLSARQTMQTAQRLYENGFITYMRTDSVHLSGEAIGAARGLIERKYGNDFLSPRPRQYTTKSKGAQEAHEAIRPSGNQMRPVGDLDLRGMEAKLYEMIWKRTVATQMADAKLRFTTVKLEVKDADGRVAEFRSSGKEVVFPGFFRAYVEGSDDPSEALEDRADPLPSMAEGDTPKCDNVEAVGHETKPPARYTEASLVKALEAAGIGRPSTYATIIDTIQARGYVNANGRQLVPTFTAMAVTSLLEQTHEEVVDLEFTAEMEGILDNIADGSSALGFLEGFYTNNLLEGVTEGEELDPRKICTITYPGIDGFHVRVGRYGPYLEQADAAEGDKPLTVSLPDETAPADITEELVQELVKQQKAGDEPLGDDPETGDPVYVLVGRFGPYVQLGERTEENPKPKRASLPDGLKPTDVTLQKALDLLALPRAIGPHPEDEKPVEAGIGRYGPYVKHGKTYASLKKGVDDVFTVGMDRALELIAEKKAKGGRRERPVLREMGEHPKDGERVVIYDGRYGPYINHQKTNASLPKGTAPEGVSMEQAVELLEIAAKKPKKKRGGRRKKK